jgi:hypothetical protein
MKRLGCPKGTRQGSSCMFADDDDLALAVLVASGLDPNSFKSGG